MGDGHVVCDIRLMFQSRKRMAGEMFAERLAYGRSIIDFGNKCSISEAGLERA